MRRHSESTEGSYRYDAADEKQPRKLPPSGISTNEYYDRRYQDSIRTSPYASTSGSSSNYFRPSPETDDSRTETVRFDNTTYSAWHDFEASLWFLLERICFRRNFTDAHSILSVLFIYSARTIRSFAKEKETKEEKEASVEPEEPTSGRVRIVVVVFVDFGIVP